MPLFSVLSGTAKQFAKFLIRETGQELSDLYDFLLDQLADEADAAPLEWVRYRVGATRNTPTGTAEDKAYFKLDFVNITSEELDRTWTTTDLATVKTALDTFLTSLAPYTASGVTFNEISAYKMAFNPTPDLTRPFQVTGPPIAKWAITRTGSAGDMNAMQVSSAVTLRTAWPKHWGRFYLPSPDKAALDAYGRWISTYRNGVGAAAKTLLQSAMGSDFYPVVPVGQVNKTPFHALLGVTQLAVDDIPDIQRRRRASTVVTRYTS